MKNIAPSWGDISREILFVVALVGLLCIPVVGVYLAYLGLSLYACLGPFRAFKALTCLFVLVYINPFLHVRGANELILRWLVFFVGGFRVYVSVLQRPQCLKKVPGLWGLCVFLVVALICNAFANGDSPVGFLKLAAFAFGVIAVLVGAHIAASKVRRLCAWLIAVPVTVVLMSFPFLFSTNGYYSWMRKQIINKEGQFVDIEDERLLGGFMGILNHAQSAGTVFALVSVVLLVLFLYSTVRYRCFLVLMAVLSVAMLVLTKARTGFLSFLIAASVAFIIPLLSRRISESLVRKVSAVRVVFVLFCVAAGALTFHVSRGGTLALLSDLVRKDSSENLSVVEAYVRSRGGLMGQSLQNFFDYPLFGIGFGRASWEVRESGEVRSGVDRGVFSLVSAPTEKGVIITAMLEEVGAVGFLAWCIMIGGFFVDFYRRRNVVAVVVLVCVLCLNFGEMNLYSMGGLGLFEWSIAGMAGAAHMYFRRHDNRFLEVSEGSGVGR